MASLPTSLCKMARTGARDLASFSSETAFQNNPYERFFSFSVFTAKGCESSASYFVPMAGLNPKSLNIVPEG